MPLRLHLEVLGFPGTPKLISSVAAGYDFLTSPRLGAGRLLHPSTRILGAKGLAACRQYVSTTQDTQKPALDSIMRGLNCWNNAWGGMYTILFILTLRVYHH